jgi:mono/diheme cytochrome c family protein
VRRPASISALLAVVVLVLTAAACGGEEDTTPSPGTVVGTTPTQTGGSATTGGPAGTVGTETGGTETSGKGGEGDAAAGKQVYADAGCGSCHTLSAAGSSGNVGPNLDDLKPSEEAVEKQVENGGAGMPAFKDQLTSQQIKDVAAFVSQSAGQ